MITIRPSTPASRGAFGLANVAYINAVATLLTMSADRLTFYGFATGNILQQSTNVDTATTPTWTNIYTFPTTGGHVIVAFTELPNGEALTMTSGGGVSKIYRSTGWGANKFTATWTQTLLTIGGTVDPSYCGHQWCSAADGTVLISEAGPKPIGGAGNVVADLLTARRVWVSRDFGLTWALIFDIYTFGQSQGVAYPAGVHIHGVSYDQDWSRLWVCYGDNTGDGRTIAGTGYAQVVYSDDSGVTWNKLATPALWNNAAPNAAQTLQFINVVILKNTVIFTPDVNAPSAPLCYPKVGYRVLGTPYLGSAIGSSVSGTPRKMGLDTRCPLCVAGVSFGTYTTEVIVSIPITDDDGVTWSRINQTIPVQTPNLTAAGFKQVLGPTLNGKIVAPARHSINNDATKQTMVADLVAPRIPLALSGGEALIVSGGTIPHGLTSRPTRYSVNATVGNRAVAVTAVDATNLTVSLTDLVGVAITVAEKVAWTAGA